MSGSIQFSSSVRDSGYLAGLASKVMPDATKEDSAAAMESFITNSPYAKA